MMTKDEKRILNLHIFFSILCVPIYFQGGIIKAALIPYVIYLFNKRDINYIYPLLFHIIAGSFGAIVLLFACFVASLRRVDYFKEHGIFKTFLLSVITYVIIFIISCYKYFVKDIGFIESVVYQQYALSVFPFFSAMLFANNKKLDVTLLFPVMILYLIVNFYTSTFLDGQARFIFFFYPLIFAYSAYLISNVYFDGIINKIILVIFVLLLFGLLNSTSTLVIMNYLIFLSVFFYNYNKRFFSRILPSVIFILTFYMLFHGIISYEGGAVSSLSEEVLNEKQAVNDFSNIYNRATFKLYQDRAPIWSAVVSEFFIGEYYLPAYDLPKNYYVDFDLTGFEQEIEYAAHNLSLELVRNYGVIFGLLLCLVYYILIFKVILKFENNKNLQKDNYLVLLFPLIYTGIVGAGTGQYTMVLSFSYPFFALLGYFYSTPHKGKSIVN